jgi:hypothetical protein
VGDVTGARRGAGPHGAGHLSMTFATMHEAGVVATSLPMRVSEAKPAAPGPRLLTVANLARLAAGAAAGLLVCGPALLLLLLHPHLPA